MRTMTEQDAAVERIRQHAEGVRMVRVVAIGPNPHEPRKTFKEESVWELALHIGYNGLHQPIMVRPASDGNAEIEYERAFGQRRHLAFIMLDGCDWTIDGERLPWADAYEIDGITHIPCLVRIMTDAELIKLSLSENAMREDVSWLDETRAIAAALAADVGLKQADIASMVGASNSQVSNRLRLLRLNDRLLRLVDEGYLPWTIARKILVLAPKSHRHDKELGIVADCLEEKMNEGEGRGKETIILDKWDVDVAIKRVLDTKGIHRSWESLTPNYEFWMGHNLRKEAPLFDLEAFKKEYSQSVHKLPVKTYSYQANEQKVTLWTCEGKIWREWQAEAKERIHQEQAEIAAPAEEEERETYIHDPYRYYSRDDKGYISYGEYGKFGGQHINFTREFKPDEGETPDDATVMLFEGFNCHLFADSGEHWHAETMTMKAHESGRSQVHLTECFQTREKAEAYLQQRQPECGWVTKHESVQLFGPVITVEERRGESKVERGSAGVEVEQAEEEAQMEAVVD